MQYEAYATLMNALSEEGILSILVQMPANLAVFDIKAADDIQEQFPKILSVYGTEDKVLNMKKYDEYRGNLPKGFKEVIIEGGCHSYFADYGVQEGDGEAKISGETKKKLTVEAIKNLVK